MLSCRAVIQAARRRNFPLWAAIVSTVAVENLYHPGNDRGFAPAARRIGYQFRQIDWLRCAQGILAGNLAQAETAFPRAACGSGSGGRSRETLKYLFSVPVAGRSAGTEKLNSDSQNWYLRCLRWTSAAWVGKKMTQRMTLSGGIMGSEELAENVKREAEGIRWPMKGRMEHDGSHGSARFSGQTAESGHASISRTAGC